MSTSLLLADDSPTIAKILGMALQSEAYEIRSVLTAEDALKELKANPPYFFLIDLTLPGTNGYEFTKLIRADSKLRQIRVLLLASAFDPVDDALFAECGADGVIAKPFDPGELREKLRQIKNAPAKMPVGSNVQGSLSGHAVTGSVSTPAPEPSAEPFSIDLLTPDGGNADELLLGSAGASEGGDADSILSNLLGGGDSNSDSPPPMSSELSVSEALTLGADQLVSPEPLVGATPSLLAEKLESSTREFTNSTALLDLSGKSLDVAPPLEPVLDLSAGFKTPPGGTALLDFSSISQEAPAPSDSAFSLNNLSEESPPPAPASSPPRSPGKPLGTAPVAPPSSPKSKAEEPLSANAKALAAFFEAEIDAKAPPTSTAPAEAPPPAEDDSFDASLSSIDWGGPKEENLNAWSSTPPAKPQSAPRAPAPAPAPSPVRASAPAKAPKEDSGFILTELDSPPAAPPATQGYAAPAYTPPARARPAAPPAEEAFTHSGASSGGDFLFDTGGSNFRFSDDYIRRITKSFTGSPGEMILGRDPSAPQVQAPSAVFGQTSNDSAPPSARPAMSKDSGGGAWSEDDVKRIEKIVREEVQMVLREVAEKVIWEVVPELAENLIRKELDKVLKEIDEE